MLLQRRRGLMGATGESVVYGYDIVGNPTINGTVLTPANGGYIKSKREFSPTGTWMIQFEVNTTAGTTNQNVFMMADENGDRIRGVQCQWYYSSTYGLQLAFYLSSNGTNWNIAATVGFQNLSANKDYLAQIRFTGSKYQIHISEDGGTIWSDWVEVSSSASIFGSGYLCFGCVSGSTPALSGTLDLSKIKVVVDDQTWWQAVKPSAPEVFPYRFVDYIENTGDDNSWIELNVVPSNTFGYRAVLSLDTRTSDTTVFGTRESSDGRITFGVNSSNKYYIGWGAYNSTAANAPVVAGGTPFVAMMNYRNDRTFKINGSSNIWGNTLPALGFTPTWNYVVLGRRLPSGNYTGAQCRIYEFKITSGSDVIRNLRPCYRISDNEIGLYDTVTESFFSNSGTGSLSKGNDLYITENTIAGTDEFLAVAESYLNQTSIVYNDGNTPIYLTTSTNGIDCSTFVIFCLLGISYSNSPYSTGVYGGNWALSANSTYEWAVDPMLYTISRYIDNSNPDEIVRLACQLGRWFNDRCKVVSLANGFSEAQPGDIVFYAHKTSGTDEWTRPTWWEHINHVAIVYTVEAAPDTYSYTQDGQTVTIPWNKTKYPYKHTVIDSVNKTPSVGTERFLERGQEDETNVYVNNCNTVCLIVRPNLTT